MMGRRLIVFYAQELQKCRKQIMLWRNDHGVQVFSSSRKNKTLMFCRRRDIDGQITLYGQRISWIKVFKFLGMWLDENLTWRKNIHKINSKYKKILNVMKCLTGSEWGTSSLAIKNICSANFIRDYRCVAYGSAAKTLLKPCCGAYKMTPVSALQVEVCEMPLYLRRK